MTEAEIMALEAGPETDALVADWVMDWPRRYDKRPIFYPPKGRPRGVSRTRLRNNSLPFHPSTDIRHAYEAEEAVPKKERNRLSAVLQDVVGRLYDIDSVCWGMMHPSPLDRCKALLIWTLRRKDES